MGFDMRFLAVGLFCAMFALHYCFSATPTAVQDKIETPPDTSIQMNATDEPAAVVTVVGDDVCPQGPWRRPQVNDPGKNIYGRSKLPNDEYTYRLTMNHSIPITRYFFKHQSSNSRPFTTFDEDMIANLISNRTFFGYVDDVLLFDLLRDFPNLFGQTAHVVVPGSEVPRYEVFLRHAMKVERVTTLEYRVFPTDVPWLRVLHVEKYWERPETFHGAVSYSNFEHDGLGRYGDPLNPIGDLQAMREMWSMIVPGGHMILAVPVGIDCVLFNAGRVYGRLRLPLLLRGWEVLQGYPKKIELPNTATCSKYKRTQTMLHGVMVLRRMADCEHNATSSLYRAVPGW
eukprot:PhF_6_TR37906/c1_g1_i4/m.56626